MAKMRAAQISKAKGPFELVEKDIPEPGSITLITSWTTSLSYLTLRTYI